MDQSQKIQAPQDNIGSVFSFKKEKYVSSASINNPQIKIFDNDENQNIQQQ